MVILGKYIHGSSDSTDVDVHYIVDELPDKAECKKFCSADPTENRNLIVISDDVVTATYKGSCDEVNNSLIATYNLHLQNTELYVTRPLERNIPLKLVKSVRGILSHLSRSQYRDNIKPALRGDWRTRIDCLERIDLTAIDFDSLLPKMSGADIKKFIAFQLGQCLGLVVNIEFYTKLEICNNFYILKPYLMRNSTNVDDLQFVYNLFVNFCKTLNVECNGTCACFKDYNYEIDLISETVC